MKYNPQFIQEVDKYIQSTQQNNQSPTVKGFAESIGTDENSIWGWATKHTKDANGVVTDQLARPEFFNAVQKIKKFEDDIKRQDNKSLNAQQELFCKLYATYGEYYAHGTRCYLKAYGLDENKPSDVANARSGASRLLTDANILSRIDELLEVEGLNDSFVDGQLLFLIRQNADLPTKRAAISEYNKLKTRITAKLDHTTNGKDLPTPIYNGRAAE